MSADKTPAFAWKFERGARGNYARCGKRLSQANPHLFRNQSGGHGLLLASGDRVLVIAKGTALAPVLADSLVVRVFKAGKVVSDQIPPAHLAAMLRSETFLSNFRAVDQVTTRPRYLADFSTVRPGYNDGGAGNRILYLGAEPQAADSVETLRRFLDVMPFASEADRTNTVGAALTVRLFRHLWPGGKPLVVVTATKSHSGKSTVTEFIRGLEAKADILYENNDWPMQSQFQRQAAQEPDLGMLCFDNVRLESAGGRARFIRSGFVESFVTTPELVLASPGNGEALRLVNHFVVVLNTNEGTLSPDLLNRAIPIHLAPRGSVHDRPCPIGNPKLEFLPANQDRIEAELRGMVERWKKAGSPPDESVRHPMTPWATVVGGILRVNGFKGFLANYSVRRVADDPVREALAILGGARPGKELRPKEWAELAVEEGLVRTLISSNERDTDKGRERAIGVVLNRFLEETFEAATESRRLRLRLEGGNRRWVKGQNAHVRYVFRLVEEEALPVEGDGPVEEVAGPEGGEEAAVTEPETVENSRPTVRAGVEPPEPEDDEENIRPTIRIRKDVAIEEDEEPEVVRPAKRKQSKRASK